MRKFTKTVLLAATLIAAAAAAPSLYAENAPTPVQSQPGAPNDHGMMGGDNGMMGMMNMMTQMNNMMETCNTMMKSHMDHHDGKHPNERKQAPAQPNKG
jgi:hypothetical protein